MFAEDVDKIKMFGGEFIGNFIGGISTISLGIVFAGYFSWQMMLLILACIPLLILGAIVQQEVGESMMVSLTDHKVTVNDDAILLSESSVNWMTTQSLGGEDILARK